MIDQYTAWQKYKQVDQIRICHVQTSFHRLCLSNIACYPKSDHTVIFLIPQGMNLKIPLRFIKLTHSGFSSVHALVLICDFTVFDLLLFHIHTFLCPFHSDRNQFCLKAMHYPHFHSQITSIFRYNDDVWHSLHLRRKILSMC